MNDQAHNLPAGDIFARLYDVIEQRKASRPEESYVASLLARGPAKMTGKLLEEAAETAHAALASDRTHLTAELCDLLFHAFVLAASQGVELADIAAELDRRFGTSGHAEKAARKENGHA